MEDNTANNNSQQTEISNDRPDLKKMAEQAALLGMPYLSDVPKIDEQVLQIISKDVALQHQIVAFERNGQNVKIAIADPHDIDALNILRFISEKRKFEFDLYLVSAGMSSDIMEQY